MTELEPATILMTIPKKANDATTYTSVWGEQMYKLAKSLGYKVVAIRGKDTTYDNVTKSIEKYHPRLYIHIGHGCPVSLNGQKECIVTRKIGIDELLSMDLERLDKILNPVKLSSCGENICQLQNNACQPLCFNETNIHLLKDSIIYAVACHSAEQLGQCAIRYGAQAYVGYQDLLLFPVDNMRSQDMTGEIHLEFLREFLIGKTIGEATLSTDRLETAYIKLFKSTKYLSLPLLWNKLNRRILGNVEAMIYDRIVNKYQYNQYIEDYNYDYDNLRRRRRI